MTETKMQLLDWLDDLCVRFIINLPQEELESVARICFQVEEAQWFYEDFIRPTDPSLPSLNLKDFCLRIFQHCPLLSAFSDSQHTAAYQEFLAYKTRVPVRGAILLNHDMTQVLLVKGWKKGATWSFPRGKINKDEKDLDCAIREVWEETGYDIGTAGLAQDDQKYIDVTMREQHLRMFVFRGVPLDTFFEPKTRKEISKIQWYRLAELPTYNNKRQKAQQQDQHGEQVGVTASKLYMVAPFLPPLKKWINQQRKLDLTRQNHIDLLTDEPQVVLSNTPTPAPDSTVDPAGQLKRLLSVNGAAPEADGTQANALLAMIRGAPQSAASPSLAPPPANNCPPRTPLEQVMATPMEPNSPHYHHVKPSPSARQQPPPAFPFPSPSQNHNASPRAPTHFDMNVHDNLQRVLPQEAGPHVHMQQRPASMQFQNMQQQLHQGHPAPLAHGPVAPAASQLPAPRLNNHAMSLLNTFKSPSFTQRQPVLHGHDMMHSPHPPHLHPHGPVQPQMLPSPGFGQPLVPNRNAHQNSLLDMFRSPDPPRAVPVPQPPPVNVASPSTIQAQPSPSSPPSSTQPPKQRTSSTLAMMTRVLPKAKPAAASPSATIQGDMFPAKHAVQQVQHARAISDAQNRPSAPTPAEASRPQISILPRPASAATQGSPAPSNNGHMPSPARLRGGHKKQPSTTNFTILQRPSPRADQNGSPEAPEIRQAPLPKQHKSVARKQSQPPPPIIHTPEPPKQFQPQILQRPKSGSPAQQDQERRPSSSLQNPGDQRNHLLAIFAKSNLGNTTTTTESRSASAMSGHSGAPLSQPCSDANMFRSRLASASSAVSNSAEDGGLKSPSTPVEAKGFLLSYLNGVVSGAGEKGKSVKRGG